jgi:KDO2-lipid IV(A) lauroyltransferase
VILYWGVRLAGLARWMPLRAAYFLGDVIATLLWWFWRGPRTIAINNMLRVTGDAAAARRAARYSFLNYSRYVVDFLRGPKIRPEDVISKVRYNHWDDFGRAFDDGRGVIVILMHFGNWDMGGAVLAARGYPLNVIADTFGNDRANDIIVKARQVRGMRVIPADRAAIGIVRAMRRNEVLAILIDTPMAGGGVEVKFFGERTMVPAGPARIALRTGARVIPVALPRASGTSDQIIAMADLDVRLPNSGDPERDVQLLTQRIFAAHERFIRAYPDQWYIFRRMWPAMSRAAATEPALASES